MIRVLAVVLLLSIAGLVSAEGRVSTQVQPMASQEQVSALLDWLEVLTAARQADRLISQSVERQVDLSAEQRSELRAALTAATGSEAVAASVQAYVAQHSHADWDRALAIYQGSLARRARNFEAALGLSVAADKFHQYQQRVAVSEQRRALARQLDALLHCSEIAVILQTEIDASTEMLSNNMQGGQYTQQDREQLALHAQQRRAHMATVAENLFLYAYRFLKDDELQAFVEQLDDPSVRAITDSALKAFVQVLKAGRAVALTNN